MTELQQPLELAPKVWDRDSIKARLQENDKAAVKALLFLYSKQTASEQNSDHTHEENGVGFSKMDSEILTSFAKFYQRTGFLSPKQMDLLKKRVGKYWKQLLTEAASRGLPASFKVARAK